MADPRQKVVKSEGGHEVRSATVPMKQVRSIALEMGFHQMNLHEAHIYPDPFPALPVVNRPAHTVELDNDNWEPAPVNYNMKKSHKVHELMDVFADMNAAEEAKDWVTCARFLGAGSYGQVYLGFRHSDLGKPMPKRHMCAVKKSYVVGHDKPARDWQARQAQKRLQQRMPPIRDLAAPRSVALEVTILKSLKNPHIVRMMDCFAVEQTRAIYLVLEYCDGGDLHREQNDQPSARFNIRQARYYFVQVIRGLAYLHTKGIAHMDIKPGNILLKISPDGKGKVAKLADFGLSIIAYEKGEDGKLSILKSHATKGTLPYYSPEMLAVRFPQHMERAWIRYTPQPVSRVDAHFLRLQAPPEVPPDKRRPIVIQPGYKERFFSPLPCDVYACGVMLHVMITGAYPYDYKEWVDGIGLDRVFRLQPETYFTFMGRETYQFICWLLEPKIKQPGVEYHRPLALQIPTHPWMKAETVGPGLSSMPNHLTELQTMHFVRRAEEPPTERGTEEPAEAGAEAAAAPAAEAPVLIHEDRLLIAAMPERQFPGRGRRLPSDAPGPSSRMRKGSM